MERHARRDRVPARPRVRKLPERRRRPDPAAAAPSSAPARPAWPARPRSRGTTTCRCSRSRCCAGAAATAGRRSRGGTRSSRRRPALLIAGCVLRFGITWDAAVASFFCATLVDDLRDRLRAAHHPEPHRPACRGRRARGEHAPPPVGGVGGRGARRRAVPLPGRARLSRRHGDGRRQAGPAARRRARAHGAGRADGRDGRRARAFGRAVRAARQRGPEDEDPVRPLPRLRRRRRALRRLDAPRRLPRACCTDGGERAESRARAATPSTTWTTRRVFAGARWTKARSCRRSTSPSSASTPTRYGRSPFRCSPGSSRSRSRQTAGALKVAVAESARRPGARRAAARDAARGRVPRRGRGRHPRRAARGSRAPRAP